MPRVLSKMSARDVCPGEKVPRFFIVGHDGSRARCYPVVIERIRHDGSAEYSIDETSVLPTLIGNDEFCGSYSIAYPQEWGTIWVHSINEECAPDNQLAAEYECGMTFGGIAGGNVLVEVMHGHAPPWEYEKARQA